MIENSFNYKKGIIKVGSFVCYKELYSGECIEHTIEPHKYSFHNQLIGKRIGNVVKIDGSEYEIISII